MAQLNTNAFQAAFGSKKTADKEDKPKTQLWLNIGYIAQVKDAESGENIDKFVSLPVGLPVDTQERLKTNSSNEVWGMFQSARNDLLDQLIELGKTLKPGEEKILSMGDNGLGIQMRRILDEQPAVKPDQNAFGKKLAFA